MRVNHMASIDPDQRGAAHHWTDAATGATGTAAGVTTGATAAAFRFGFAIFANLTLVPGRRFPRLFLMICAPLSSPLRISTAAPWPASSSSPLMPSVTGFCTSLSFLFVSTIALLASVWIADCGTVSTLVLGDSVSCAAPNRPTRNASGGLSIWMYTRIERDPDWI